MKHEEIKGKAFVYGANIDTDQIYPGRYLELTEPEEIARHTLAGADADFMKEFVSGDIVLASTNFGCGSSREHAPIALKTAGVGAVIADSFGRIFYRNAINLGIPVLVCKGLAAKTRKGDVLRVDFLSGKIVNETTGDVAQAEPLSEYTLTILANGGIKPMVREQLLHSTGNR